MLRGEVAARKTAQETAEKAQSEENICALHTAEEIFAAHQEAKPEQEARVVRAAEEILAARNAEKEIVAEEDRTMRRAEEAAAEQARIDAMVKILAGRQADGGCCRGGCCGEGTHRE